jgi:hypothetical protein
MLCRAALFLVRSTSKSAKEVPEDSTKTGNYYAGARAVKCNKDPKPFVWEAKASVI